MRSSMVFASLFLLLLSTRAHGLRRLDKQQHAALDKKEDSPDSKLRQSPANRMMNMRRASDGQRGSGPMTGQHPTSSARGAPEEDDDVKMMASISHTVAPRLFHEDYVGPSGHSPNHHRTIPCVPC